MNSSRRGFLKLGGSALSASWVATHWPALLIVGQTACVAKEKQTPFKYLSTALATDLAAIAAQIIPGDDNSPGADQAGVIYFIDGALDTVMKGSLDSLQDGLAKLNSNVARVYPGKRFAGLTGEQQIAVLKSEDQSPFFSAVRFLTIAGMFALPSHGGNRDNVGWDLLGFDARHGWQPPFGYYDAQAASDD